ncbi:MAG: hypothetical protein K2H09_03520, partial [Treponemataceae bacterium]|nr:hypothetical protein [Treponemataceae bacterium]
MKLRKWILAALACAAVLFAGCANDSSGDSGSPLPDAPAEIADGYIRVNYKGSGSKYRLWIWGDFAAEEIASYGSSWPNGKPFMYSKDGFICVDVKLADKPASVSMLVYDTSNAGQSPDTEFNFPARYNQIFLFPDDGTAYISADKGLPKGVSAAMFTSDTVIAVSGADVTLSAATVSVADKNGTAVPAASYDSDKMTITLASSIKSAYSTSAPYTLTVTDGGATDTVVITLDPTLLDTWFGTAAVTEAKADSRKLGVTPNGATASFKMWAPLATSVNLLLYKDSASLKTEAKTVALAAGSNGFWTADDVPLDGSTYYQYEVNNNGTKSRVSDIWSYVASADSVASQIATVDDAAAVPAGWEADYTNPWNGTDYRDAVIYEMHIRDWSRAVASDSTGKFLDIANSEQIISHLKDIGVTHVQILPMFDYAQTNADKNYNWG